MIMNGDIAGARRRHAIPWRRSCAGSAGMPHPGAHASGVPLWQSWSLRTSTSIWGSNINNKKDSLQM